MNSASYHIQFNPTGFTITDVLAGQIGEVSIPVDEWNFVNNSTLVVTQSLSGLSSVSGGGSLARIQAVYAAGAGQTDTFAFDANSSFLGNDQGEAIPPFGKERQCGGLPSDCPVLARITVSVHHFTAEICAVGINRCVDVPRVVSESLGGQTHIQVKGSIGGEDFRSNLAPRGGGGHRLFIHSTVWRKLGVDTGDMLDVELERDDEEWQINIPTDLADAMPPGSEALAAFQALTVPNRKRFVDRIEEAKSPETRKRRVEQSVQLLIERLRKQRKR